ncbi:MAG: IS5 family transposase [Nitrososphaeraceae archaeon]
MINWRKYNQSLVKRGEIMLGFDVIDNWDNELKEMNKGKVGEPFHYPNSFLLLLGYARVYFHLPFRQTEGVVLEHASNTLPSIPDYSTINRRINKLEIHVNNSIGGRDDVIIAIDSTGIKVTNRGEWMRHKWHCKSRKGYLKIHVAVDINNNNNKITILSLNVTTEKVHDSKVLPILVHDIVRQQNIDVNTVIADGSYDNNKIFQFLSFNNIKPAIKVRKNARISRKDNHYKRNVTVLEQKIDFDKWKDSVSYGKRWIVESVFSSMKRMFGEYISAVKYPNMVKEIILKASLYNLFISTT